MIDPTEDRDATTINQNTSYFQVRLALSLARLALALIGDVDSNLQVISSESSMY
jgi:hypothetical protein